MRLAWFLGFIPLAVLIAAVGRTAEESKDTKDTKVFAADKGPDQIDDKVVAAYCKTMQDTYALFRKRCSKCHTPARPINTDKTPTDWQIYIKKMRGKPGSGITLPEAKSIWNFLVYDTVKRRTDFFEKMPDAEKETAKKVADEADGGAK